MELKEVLLKRRSVRRFADRAVPDEMIDELMHAAMSGPSACNKLPWQFYVVTCEEKLAALRKTTLFTRMNAPLAIVVCGDLSNALPRELADYWIQDCSAATENILLRAVDLGLGAVWCGIHPQKKAEKKVADLLELGDKLIPLNIIWVGYPNEQPEARDQFDAQRVHFVR